MIQKLERSRDVIAIDFNNIKPAGCFPLFWQDNNTYKCYFNTELCTQFMLHSHHMLHKMLE